MTPLITFHEFKFISHVLLWCVLDNASLEIKLWDTRGRFHEKSQFETSFGLSLGLKSETFVSAEFLAQIDFTKGDSAETGLKS